METKNQKEFDTYFKAAALLFIKYQSVSTSLLQRKFMIGYNRAGRIFEQLEEQEIIKSSTYIGKYPHELLVKDEELLTKKLENIELGNQIMSSELWNKNL